MSLGDVLVWIPRGLLLPLYLTNEYLLRRPLVGLLALAERHYVFEWAKWLFLWHNEDITLIPTLFVDFGLRTSGGLYVSYKNMLGSHQNTSLRAAFGGRQWVNVYLAQRFGFYEGETAHLELSGGYLTRPDQPIYGVGPDTEVTNKRFYRPLLGQAKLKFTGEISGLNRLSAEIAYRNADFKGGQSPSVTADVQDPQLTLYKALPGFTAYNLFVMRVDLALDTRAVDPLLTAGSGARLELFGSFSIDPGDPRLSFFTWGYDAGLMWDFSGYHHVIGIRLYMAFLEVSGSRDVPFYELPSLGGVERMRGFLERRFIGDSVVDATVTYTYPVWAILDGTVFVGVGNAFLGHLRDFEPDNLFLNWGFGLRTSGDRDTSFELLVAFGSNRIDTSNFDPVDQLRLVFGVNSGS